MGRILPSVMGRERLAAAQAPDSCPFTIHKLSESTYLVRENDPYGEHPHIYVKVYTRRNHDGIVGSVVVLSDTGVGTTTQTERGRTRTIKTFLEFAIDVDAQTPYLVILSHCHYDHILGLKHLLVASNAQPLIAREIKIVSSARDRQFVTPYETLNKHSQCEYNNIKAPDYKTDIWAEDGQCLTYPSEGTAVMNLNIRILQTPGHTPDSLSWYDEHDRILFVGDSFYQQTSVYTDNASWGTEAPLPIIFPFEGNLLDWWQSLAKLVKFVEHENRHMPPVRLAAAHVTALVDAHRCLSNVKAFMMRVLDGDVVFEHLPDREGRPMGHWKDKAESGPDHLAEFSVTAPVELIEKGRIAITNYLQSAG